MIDFTLARNPGLLREGAVLVDETDLSSEPRVLFLLEHALEEATEVRPGERRVISRRLLFVELFADGRARDAGPAPYLDYRPLADDEPKPAAILAHPACAWLTSDLERRAREYAASRLAREHLQEVRERRLALLAKTEKAVKQRLLAEIAHWEKRALALREAERAGRPEARMNAVQAEHRADEMRTRQEHRLKEIERQRQIVPMPPKVLGAALVVLAGLLQALRGLTPPPRPADPQAIAARARAIVMAEERRLGFEPRDVEQERLGYDIESRNPNTGRLRFIEVKGRMAGAETITVTRNEILTALNLEEAYILAIVEFAADGRYRLIYVPRPFGREPDFHAASVNYTVAQLLARAERVSGWQSDPI